MNEKIKNFSLMHAEPSWLSELRQTAFEAMTELEMPNIERVKFNRWGLDNTEIGDSEPSGNVPSFTELPNHPLLVQVGSQNVMEQMRPDLAEKV